MTGHWGATELPMVRPISFSQIAEFLRRAKLVVPFPPGGSSGYVAEVLAHALERQFGSVIALDYQVGDYGLNALRTLAHSEDDHVLLIGNIIATSMTPVFHRDKMAFDFQSEIVPITRLAEFPSVLMVNLSVPVNDVVGLLELCRRRDGVLRYGSDFLGTFADVDAIEMAARAGLSPAFHEANGANGILSALIAGHIDMALLNVATATANKGKFKPLAVSGTRHLTGFPDLPTMSEAGLDGIGVIQWQGIFASRRLRPELLEGLYDSVVRAVNTQAARLAMEAVDAAVVTSASPAAFGAEIKVEMARWESMKEQILALPRV
jgi:tripartite-type tricarboxylate transporter receptor subunit TctC